MLDLVERIHFFELGVFEQIAVDEAAMDGDVDVLVDRRRDDEPAVLAVVRRQVGAAPSQGNPQRASGDDHRASPQAVSRSR